MNAGRSIHQGVLRNVIFYHCASRGCHPPYQASNKPSLISAINKIFNILTILLVFFVKESARECFGIFSTLNKVRLLWLFDIEFLEGITGRLFVTFLSRDNYHHLFC